MSIVLTCQEAKFLPLLVFVLKSVSLTRVFPSSFGPSGWPGLAVVLFLFILLKAFRVECHHNISIIASHPTVDSVCRTIPERARSTKFRPAVSCH